MTLAELITLIGTQIPDNNQNLVTPVGVRTTLEAMSQFSVDNASEFVYVGIKTPASAATADLATVNALGIVIETGSYTNYLDGVGNPIFVDPAEPNYLFGIISSPIGQAYWTYSPIIVTLPPGAQGPKGDPGVSSIDPAKVLGASGGGNSTEILSGTEYKTFILTGSSTNYIGTVALPGDVPNGFGINLTYKAIGSGLAFDAIIRTSDGVQLIDNDVVSINLKTIMEASMGTGYDFWEQGASISLVWYENTNTWWITHLSPGSGLPAPV